MLDTPILFIVFNRPETTKQVFSAIKKARPRQLFIAADGPRNDRPGEALLCEDVRRIATQVDWECEIHTLFREENFGCGYGPAQAISWFFQNVERGIILEDDCLPNPTFFTFCEVLLNYYSDNSKVMHISGNNFQFGKVRGKASYYFSKYSHNWGWATWRRAWELYQFELSDLETNWSRICTLYLSNKKEMNFWWKIFQELKHGKRDVWDGQWQYTIWKNEGVSILPNKNLITNIGFGMQATHTFQETSELANMKTGAIAKVTHPDLISIYTKADNFSFERAFLLKGSSNIFVSIITKVKQKLKNANSRIKSLFS